MLQLKIWHAATKTKKISYDTTKTQHSQINIFLKDPEDTVTFCKPAIVPWLLLLSFVLPKESCSCQPWSPPSERTPGRSDSMVCLGFYIIFCICVPIVLTLIPVCVQHMFIGLNDDCELLFGVRREATKFDQMIITRDLPSKRCLFTL